MNDRTAGGMMRVKRYALYWNNRDYALSIEGY